LTQAELAKKIHTTQSVISRLEDADYEGHSLAILQRIGKELGYKIKITLVKDGLSEKDNGIINLLKEILQNTIRDEVSKATKIIALTPMPGTGTTKDENGLVAIKGESR
jgi:transcriptional regulator with XRE-family HTH domain